MPDATPILGAAKIAGRTQNGYTIGLLNAVTGKSMADVQRVDGTRFSQEVEPLSNYFVGRVKKDLLGGNLVVGAIGTGVTRSLDDQFRSRLSSNAELVGTDMVYSWDNKAYSLSANLAMSNVEGDSTVILAKQLSSARYFQRPDRGRRSGGFFSTRLDSGATALRGLGGYTRLAKDAGDWLWETAVNWRTASFETNDYSFLTNADYVWNNVNVFRNWTKPTSWYRQLQVIVGGQMQHNFDGDLLQGTQAQAFVGGQTPQFWNWNTFYIWYPGGIFDDRLMRGGPAQRIPETSFNALNLSTDSRKQWQFSVNPSYSRDVRGGWSASPNISASFQPSRRVYVSFGPSFSNSRSKLQYVQTVADPTATAFGGTRYVLSDLRQESVSLDTRLNVTFTPRMTLQLYLPPFIASAHYLDFKEFNAPRSGDYSVYGRDRGTVSQTLDVKGRVTSYTIDPDGTGPAAAFTIQNPDFNFRSLRGNAVFRWEYHPGSTLYFAWTQSRSDMASIGDFNFPRDREALFAAHPDNIFLLKASWWLSK